jgi:hypothetical protein
VRIAILEVYEEKAMENDQITMELMRKLFVDYEDRIKTYIREQIFQQEMPTQLQQATAKEGSIDNFGVPFTGGKQEPQPPSTIVVQNFAHSDRFIMCPRHFSYQGCGSRVCQDFKLKMETK